MKVRKVSWKSLVFVFLAFSLLFTATPAFAKTKSKSSSSSSSTTASFQYNQVDMEVNCISYNELEITVTEYITSNNVLCWWGNYGGNTSIPTNLQSVEVGKTEDSLTALEITDKGAAYRESGQPERGTAAYDSKYLMLYISPGTLEPVKDTYSTPTANEYANKYPNRYTGDFYLRYKTKMTGIYDMWNNDGLFNLTPFITNDSSTVPIFNLTINNADKLFGEKGTYIYGSSRDVVEQITTCGVNSELNLLSSDGKTLVYKGKLAKNSRSNVYLSADEIPWDVRLRTEYPYWFLVVTLLLFILVLLVYAILFHVLGKKTLDKSLRKVYFRDVPKTDNPVAAVCKALSYRTPYSTTSKDLIDDQNLIAYVILKNKDEGTARFVEVEGHKAIEVDWGKLDDKDRKVYEHFTLTRLSRIIKFDNNILTPDVNGVVTIYPSHIKSFAEKLKRQVKGDKVDKYKDKLEEYEKDCLTNIYTGEHRKKRTDDMRNTAIQKVILYTFSALVPLCFVAAVLYGWFSSDINNIYYASLAVDVTLGFVLVYFLIRFLVERFERYSKEDLEITKQVLGLRNWILDFTLIKEQKPEADIVWGDFIKWAYLLGLQEQAMKIAKEFSDIDVSYSLVTMTDVMNATTMAVITGSLVATSICSSASLSAASATASSIASVAGGGGGGFGGGGSGGGGGGGGGCR